jgi:hypothetical protein
MHASTRFAPRIFILFLVMLTACQAANPAPTPTPSDTPPPATRSATFTLPADTPTATASATLSATPSDTPAPTTTSAPAGFTLRTHPDGDLFVGDQVSFEVIAPPEQPELEGQEIEVTMPAAGEPFTRTVKAKIGLFGIGRRVEAVFYWSWDTTGLEPGKHTLRLRLLPDGETWSETITLRPAAELPPPEPQAKWASTYTQCCIIHYITGTAAERDLPELKALIDEQARDAAKRMGIGLEKPLEVNLVPRVLGHGGFASGDLSVTYLDENYLLAEVGIIFHHEMIHVLDARLGGKYRPSALVEGLATYESQGHYKPVNLAQTAAALLPPYSENYVPLTRLFDNFYLEQHEVGYIEAAALIDYLVRTGGKERYNAFYRQIEAPEKGEKPSQVVDRALRTHYHFGLEELDQRFRNHLEDQLVTEKTAADLTLSLRFYDLVRAYQQQHDPSAYFLYAWLLDRSEMEKRGIVADYLRHPQEAINIRIETALEAAAQALRQGRYEETKQLLDEVQALLAGG